MTTIQEDLREAANILERSAATCSEEFLRKSTVPSIAEILRLLADEVDRAAAE